MRKGRSISSKTLRVKKEVGGTRQKSSMQERVKEKPHRKRKTL